MHIAAVAGRSLGLQASGRSAGILLYQADIIERLGTSLAASEAWPSRAVEAVWSWLAHTFPALLVHPFAISTAWTLQASLDAAHFVQQHPHTFHILGWSIFFGPIIILVPCLLLLELLILILLHLGSLLHGQALGSPEDRFQSLIEYFEDFREVIFATVDHWTATFNTWTTDYPLLLIIRLLGGGLGLFIFIGLMTEWK